jgi:hypothetical protein
MAASTLAGDMTFIKFINYSQKFMSEGKGLSDGLFKGVANEDYHLVGPSSE